MAAGAGRRQRILDAVAALPGHEPLDDPVLDAVVADDGHASTGPERGQGTGKAGAENLDLAVDRDAQGLEGPRGGVDTTGVRAAGTCRGSCRDDGGQVGGGHQPTLRTRRHDRLRDAASTALFTKRREYSGELSLRGALDELD